MTSEEYGAAYQAGFRATARFIAKRGRIWFEEAEDIAQEAWTRGWEPRGQLRDPRFVNTWVNRIAINLFLVRKRKHPLYALPLNLQGATTDTNQIAVRQVLGVCCSTDRRLMSAYYIAGLKVREIALIEHSTVPWVKIRLYRARMAARDILS
jgi:DNA-directed RNA polymerase specialized sigma24 family protein